MGAGDALLAYATLAILASGSAAEATILGSMAAACECELDGNVPRDAERRRGPARRRRAPHQLCLIPDVMRVVVVGLGVQGRKRRAVAGAAWHGHGRSRQSGSGLA